MWRAHGSPGKGLAGVALAATLVSGALFVACSGDSTGLGENLLTVATVTIDPPGTPPRVLAPGATAQLTAVAKNDAGDVVNVTFIWSSNDPAVASVSATGLVTARAVGVATITAAAGGKSGTAAVVVAVPGTSVVIEPAAAYVDVGGTLQLAATVKDASGNVLTVPVTFSSQNPAVATVNATGLVAGVALGEATIVAAAEGTFGAARITVQTAVASIDLAPTPSVIEVGDTVQLTATPKDAGGKAVNRPVTWGSSNTAVATVDAGGRVIGTGPGTVEITAAAGSKQGKAALEVQAKAASLTISGAPSGNQPVMVGGTLQLTAVVKDADGNVLDRKVSWSSSAADIASVDQNGLVTGVARGDATITASFAKLSATLAVRVAGEGEETAGNNLSVPVIFAEGIGVTGELLGTGNGLRPTAEEGIAVDALPFFYGANKPDCGVYFCQGGANVWQAQWLDGSALGVQSAEVKWGDNLTHHQFDTHTMLRVEVGLAAWSSPTMMGYNMPYAIGQGPDQMQGTDGTTAAMVPNIYAVTPRLIIQKLDDVTREPLYTVFDGAVWQKFGTDGPGGFGAEVNVAGAVVYGFNFVIRDIGLPSEFHRYGWWRITFQLDNSAQVGGATVLRNVSLDQLSAVSAEEEPPLYTPQIDPANQKSWLDIEVKSAKGGGGGEH